jgi:hypothetical protein
MSWKTYGTGTVDIQRAEGFSWTPEVLHGGLRSVADPNPGSGVFFTPGSGSGKTLFRIPHPTPIFLRAG